MNSSTTDFWRRIGGAETSDECRVIKDELEAHLKRVDKKIEKLEEIELEIGLNYQGRAGFECHCGNRVDRTKRYFSCCQGCYRDSCVECLSKCDVCGTTNFCCEAEDDETCLIHCMGCEEHIMCPECRSNTKTCDECDLPTCDDCLKPLAGEEYCPGCYDHINAGGSRL